MSSDGRKNKLYKWLRQDGFSHAAASGIIGNFSASVAMNSAVNCIGGKSGSGI